MVKAVLRSLNGVDHVSFFCLGCNHPHTLALRPAPSPSWIFDGNLEQPTISPSVHVNPPGEYHTKSHPICHSFVTDGEIQYLSDCTHGMVGTYEMPEYPKDWQ